MSDEKTLLQVRLDEISAELADARENCEQLYKRINSAESELRFYAEATNYKVPKNPALTAGVFQHSLPTDCESVGKQTFVAGKRARDYFKRFNPLSHT
jgi:hypothetical protein